MKPTKLTRIKSRFDYAEIEYLGHFILAKEVKTDGAKLKAVVEWLLPKSLKALRGFLGLTGYYQKFGRGYGTIATTLTSLLKISAFSWIELATMVVTNPPVLALEDFDLPFVIECDSLGKGIVAVLMQCQRPIAFFNQAL
ncbi:uncharacterized mitochondrial protein AtMg00860-like [Alnus glutinosa]|uniref:uncharacterized mitochondrial protein AtMg00860-like n=1 Tax=Alnus glutinosa TaxID=3517 RepID=UPI002D7A27E5|nr:uncharacterized mitochondrial protein AtMg00860-like [Alnus glutinosa]